MKINEKFKFFLGDSALSIVGLVLMHSVAQFFVYPYWNTAYGVEKYGSIIYLITIMNVLAIPFGTSISYARITISAKNKTKNAEYLLLLSISAVVIAAALVLFCSFGGDDMPFWDRFFYVVLALITMVRFYADVEFRLKNNYFQYFLYYVFIGLGYALGVLLMKHTGFWALALIPGEVFGILFVCIKGSVLKPDSVISKPDFTVAGKLFLVLLMSSMTEQLIFNSDRILIKNVLSEEFVSIFYVTTLLGKTMSLITTPLNGVISGKLARYKEELTLKKMGLLTAAVIAAPLIFAGLCVAGSYILIPILYPDIFESAKQYLFIGSLSQTIYFTSNVIGVIMLRFTKSKNQLFISMSYACAFVVVCIPCAIRFGFAGVFAGILIASIARWLAGISVGYVSVIKNKKMPTCAKG